MDHQWIAAVALAVCCAVSVTSGATDIALQVQSCEDCHGTNGVSQHTDMPTIAGLSAGSHEDALYAYVDAVRPCAQSDYRHGDTSRAATDMCAITKSLTEDEIAKLAEYFAAKEFVPMTQEFDSDKAKAGEAVHNAECKKCHSDGGSNPEDDASIIAGQPIGYLTSTFKEYSSGKREQPKKMKPKMDALSDADTEALIHYYTSQQ